MNARRPRIGIALDSGGAKGGAHIGILDVFRENGIPIDIIVGSSAGAFTGAMYATGTMDKFKGVAETMTWRDSLNYYLDPVFPQSGLLAGKRARTFIRDILGEVMIENLPTTFVAVATDLLNGETVAIDKGPIVDAVMASCSMPGIFKPVVFMEQLLTDGGVTDPLPLDVLARYQPDITIAVNLHPRIPDLYATDRFKAIIKDQQSQSDQEQALSSWVIDRLAQTIRSPKILENMHLPEGLRRKVGSDGTPREGARVTLQEQLLMSKDSFEEDLGNNLVHHQKPQSMNIFDIMVTTSNIQQYQKNRLMLAHQTPDILIEPDVANIGSLEFTRVMEAIAEGRDKALTALEQIRGLLT